MEGFLGFRAFEEVAINEPPLGMVPLCKNYFSSFDSIMKALVSLCMYLLRL